MEWSVFFEIACVRACDKISVDLILLYLAAHNDDRQCPLQRAIEIQIRLKSSRHSHVLYGTFA